MNTVLFENDTIEYMIENFNLDYLKREKHHAELELHAAEYWNDPENTEYWEQYLDLVSTSIKEILTRKSKTRAAVPNNDRVSAGDIKNRLDIVAVIGDYTRLRKAGSRFPGLCPLHDERNPSLIVYPESKSWHCFSCNRGGDVFDFVQLADKIDFKSALNKLERF